MPIEKANRVLIVINQLDAGDMDYLYRFIEFAGRNAIQAILGDDYQKIIKLYDSNATYPKLINALKVQGARRAVHRIDLIVMLHGKQGIIKFKDGEKKSRQIGDEISTLNLRGKLRLLYNTSCYGDSHSADFIRAGFDAAIGSKKVNANAAVEFPLLLSLWQFNNKLSDCLAPTIPLTPAADAAAKAHGQLHDTSWKNDVDSAKVLRGNIRIST
jgi:hypothetical protein